MRRRPADEKASRALFRGPLAEQFEQFLAYRRALRSAHEHLLVALCHLDRFLVVQSPPSTASLDPELLRRWLRTLEGRKPQTVGNYQRVACQFCEYGRRFEGEAYLPEKWRMRPDPSFRPYIFSEVEIRALLAAAEQLRGTLRPRTIRLLILLLYTAGLRIDLALKRRILEATGPMAVRRRSGGKQRQPRARWHHDGNLLRWLDRI